MSEQQEAPDNTAVANGLQEFVSQFRGNIMVNHWVAGFEATDMNTGEEFTGHVASWHSSPATVRGVVEQTKDRLKEPVFVFGSDDDDDDDEGGVTVG